MTRLALNLALLAAASAYVNAAHAQQQAYPAKPVRIIVPFAPSGPNDILARIIGQKWTEAWAHPTVVENRGGAGGTIGIEYGAKTPPDGSHTILYTHGG